MALKDFPEWVLKHKKKNVELRLIRGKFSAYKIKNVWDKDAKRSKKITLDYLGTITEEGLIPPKSNLISLRPHDKTLRDIQILKELEAGKDKPSLAEKYEITTKTITNIKKRFDEDGVKGLIHTRASNIETVKVSTSEQAAIITEAVLYPNKTAKEVKETTAVKSSIQEIQKLITPVLANVKLKKKVVLEIG